MFSPSTLTPATSTRSALTDELESRYLVLHEGDRESAARHLAVDVMMLVLRDAVGDEPGATAPDTATVHGPATSRRLRRAAVMACGVFRLPMPHAEIVHDDTVETALRRMLPRPLGADGDPITRRDAAALTSRRAA